MIGRFTEVLGLERFASTCSTTAPRSASAWRSPTPSASARSSRRTATPTWKACPTPGHPITAYWNEPSQANRDALRGFLAPQTTLFQYTHGVSDPALVSPDGRNLDDFYLARPGNDEIQLDLLGDYKTNVALYGDIQAYLRDRRPPVLAIWGRNDPFFIPPGAEAFKRDVPDAEVRFVDSGHFALETHAREIGAAMRDFLAKHLR